MFSIATLMACDNDTLENLVLLDDPEINSDIF